MFLFHMVALLFDFLRTYFCCPHGANIVFEKRYSQQYRQDSQKPTQGVLISKSVLPQYSQSYLLGVIRQKTVRFLQVS